VKHNCCCRLAATNSAQLIVHQPSLVPCNNPKKHVYEKSKNLERMNAPLEFLDGGEVVYGADGAPLGGLLGLSLRVVEPEGPWVLDRVRGGQGRSTSIVGDLVLLPVVVLGPEKNAWVVEVVCSGGLDAPRSHRGV
jgi:hypothetical protein